MVAAAHVLPPPLKPMSALSIVVGLKSKASKEDELRRDQSVLVDFAHMLKRVFLWRRSTDAQRSFGYPNPAASTPPAQRVLATTNTVGRRW